MADEEKYDYQTVLETVVKALVDNPDEVQVERKVDEMGVLLSLKVHKDDMGAVVGRQGATARAIRTLVRIIGMKNNARVNLKIEEPEGGKRSGSQGMGEGAAAGAMGAGAAAEQQSSDQPQEQPQQEETPSSDSLDNFQL